jgi:hypothetical protein
MGEERGALLASDVFLSHNSKDKLCVRKLAERLRTAPERKTTTWKEFIRTHMEVLAATDFFTAEVWTLGGLMTYYVHFFIHLSSRKMHNMTIA